MAYSRFNTKMILNMKLLILLQRVGKIKTFAVVYTLMRDYISFYFYNEKKAYQNDTIFFGGSGEI